MTEHVIPDVFHLRRSLQTLCASQQGLRALILFGSRARGTQHAWSDWDFGYLSDAGFMPSDMDVFLIQLLQCDNIDLVNLPQASIILQRRACHEGILLYEREAGIFAEYCESVARLWCDMGPVLSRALEEKLQSI